MSTEEMKAIVHRFNDGLNEYFRTGNLAPLRDTLHPQAVFDLPGMPPNFDGMTQVLPAFRTAFPDFHLTTGEMIAEGDKVAYRVTWSGTHKGNLMGIPPTEKQVTVTETHIDHIADGKIVRHEGDWDQMGMMQQLGVIPAPG